MFNFIKKLFNNVFTLLGLYSIFYCCCNIICTIIDNKISTKQKQLTILKKELDHVNGQITIKHKKFLFNNTKLYVVHRDKYIEPVDREED